MNIQKTQNPKAKQFTEELNELLAKYQFTLEPKLQQTSDGIFAVLVIGDQIPPKGNGKPPVEAGQVEPATEGASGAIAIAKVQE